MYSTVFLTIKCCSLIAATRCGSAFLIHFVDLLSHVIAVLYEYTCPSTITTAPEAHSLSAFSTIMKRTRSLCNERRYVCTHPGCEKASKTASNLTAHMLRHGERTFCCQIPDCSASFYTKSDLSRHLEEVHAEGKNFACVFTGCGREYKSKRELKMHQAMHADSKAYTCDYDGCSFESVYLLSLKAHVASQHSSERPYVCNFPGCPKAFAVRGKLKQHLVSHGNERNYTCEHEGCGQKFKHLAALRTHTLLHTGQTPFVCPREGCGKAFAQAGNLKTHIMGHDGDKPFVCPDLHCEMAFTHASRCRLHYDLCHSEKARLRRKREEEKIAKCFAAAGIDFAREHRVDFRCLDSTSARGDFIVLMHGCVFIVEVDERQHEEYEQICEVSRMTKIHSAMAMEGNTLPFIFIRYNPHAFRINDQLEKVPTVRRQKHLVDVIKGWKPSASCSLSVLYMYYDASRSNNAASLKIWDKDYDAQVRACCLDPVL